MAILWDIPPESNDILRRRAEGIWARNIHVSIATVGEVWSPHFSVH